jgi:penicillin amidase
LKQALRIALRKNSWFLTAPLFILKLTKLWAIEKNDQFSEPSAMKWFVLALVLGLTSAVFYFLNFSYGNVPPLGKFLNPLAGFWQNDNAQDEVLSDREVPELQDVVEVVWDERRVPHIFARNDHDLYFTQGFLIARDRLWQMEFQTHAAAGRLSEIVGPRALEFDRHRRRIGMGYAAENAIGAMAADPKIKLAAEAYAAGVNAWIRQLTPATLPLEYKILDYQPEPWTILKSALLLKQMALTLTTNCPDRLMTATREALGDSVMRRLFPNYPPLQDPIVPAGTKWDFQPPQRVTQATSLAHRAAQTGRPGYVLLQDQIVPADTNWDFQPPQRVTQAAGLAHRAVQTGSLNYEGSNNWAVSGKKTASGYPILCNDPHLGLTLPSIWYEVQLIAPGVNVYGVTLTGAPGVIIGFNEDIAWGVTNAESDVLDWFEIKFKDASRREYFRAGQWRPATIRIEEIKVRGGTTVRDTVIYAHHGPVPYRKNEKPFDDEIPPGAAMRWAAHDSSRELTAFFKLNRGRNYQDYLDALSYYDCPAQNFVYADAEGNIAIRHNGKFPVRWFEQGKYLGDGSDLAHDWKTFIPKSQLPGMLNPERGFVSSANQNPVDENYPYYLGWNYAAFERGHRINEFLSSRGQFTPQDMMALHQDVVSLRARTMLPRFLELLEEEKLTAEQKQILTELKSWNYEYQAGTKVAMVFNNWWRELLDLIWKDDMKSGEQTLKLPRSDVTMNLILHEPESPYYDNKTTPTKETLADLVLESFQNTHQMQAKKLGPYGEAWAWSRARGTNIAHIARIPGLGRMKLSTPGNFDNVNAITNTHGPSWRMIVALGPELKAWGVYPGGQSGNPGSEFYDNGVDKWVAGEYFELLYLKDAHVANARISGKTLLRGGK